ncbi:MAG: hypothetical protein GY863_01705 [bacterium]|nr:hypothetical protein [bacterium]
MAITGGLRMMHSGRPVKPNINLRLTNDIQRKAISRADVKSAKELFMKNTQNAKSTPIELGAKASKVIRQVRAGRIDILS